MTWKLLKKVRLGGHDDITLKYIKMTERSAYILTYIEYRHVFASKV